MSFVGTRPEAVKYVEKYKPEYYATLLLPAGITSEASIRYKDEAKLRDHGKIYMGPHGETMKAFSIKDGYVINFILKPVNIKPVIITARTSSIVQNRCDELGITESFSKMLENGTYKGDLFSDL